MKKEWCDRCGKPISKEWHDQWPCFGEIKIGCASQAMYRLYNTHLLGKSHYGQLPKELHPVIDRDDSGGQKAVLRWEHDSGFRMCNVCQGELIVTIGKFFRMEIPAVEPPRGDAQAGGAEEAGEGGEQ